MDASNDADKAIRGKSNAFLRFAQGEAYKAHIAGVIKGSGKDNWLRDKKFDTSIWNYISNVFNDVVTGQIKPSGKIYDFAPERNADAYSGANWNALVFRNAIKYAFLLEQSTPDLNDLKTEFEKQTISDNILGRKYGKLIEFAGTQLGKTEKFNKDRHFRAIQAAVSDIKKYFRGCQLGGYIDELLKCHMENLKQFDKSSLKPQCCSFPNVQGYFCAGKDEKHDYLENFGYVEFVKPVDISDKVYDWASCGRFIKKRYYRAGVPDAIKMLSNDKKTCIYRDYYFGYKNIQEFNRVHEYERFYACFRMSFRDSFLIDNESAMQARLLCEPEKVEAEIRELFSQYRELCADDWIDKHKNDDEFLKKTAVLLDSGDGLFRDVYLIEMKQEFLQQEENINLYRKWLDKILDIQIVDLNAILNSENVEEIAAGKTYFLYGDYDSWFKLRGKHSNNGKWKRTGFLRIILGEELERAKGCLENDLEDVLNRTIYPINDPDDDAYFDLSFNPGEDFIAKLPEYIKRLRIMFLNCEKLPECEGLSSRGIDIKCAVPDTLCTTKEGMAFLLKFDKLERLKKTFVESLGTFRREKKARLRREFENVKELVKQSLERINEEFYDVKNRNVNVRMHVSNI